MLLLINLKSDQPARPQPEDSGEPTLTVAQWAKHLRPRFQMGLLGYIRGERTMRNLEVLSEVAEKLERLATTQPLFQLWWVVGALLEAVRGNGLDESATLKRLLGQTDRQIKALYEMGEARYSEDPPADLLNNLLYHVARATADGGRIAAVRAAFKLAELPAVDDSIEQARDSLSSLNAPGDKVVDNAEAPQDHVFEAGSAPVLPGRAGPAERVEMARVNPILLDTMLNDAGEVSIFRVRLEQQVDSIDFNLAELARTVTRFKEQLRGLEIETEAQTLGRHHDEGSRHDDFDPLELDRYSALQTFTRALAETSGDVASIQGLLETLTREARNLLTGQARIVTELQNSLMRTRMVPFQRHVQRLKRLVRQAANDTGKRAELVVQGAAAELDRQMLERMVAPLEHMLRNAVVHGIEMPERRVHLAKPEVGRISVSLTRDGAEIVVVVHDDGGGINVGLIREKAIALGLVDRQGVLTDEQVIQLILQPGFSTAGHVTQAAGRGVGMDVVATEVKKLGGALFIESAAGKGTQFTIRLPLTLAISQALIVRIADETYALPLATVEGVVRLPRDIVARHFGKDTPLFEYGGQKYRFQQLGSFVGMGHTQLPEADAPISVVLIRAGEHSTALLTDELVGSREIVVKPLGPQVSGIRGIAGATILGDGRIVIILDIGSLVRSECDRTVLPD